MKPPSHQKNTNQKNTKKPPPKRPVPSFPPAWLWLVDEAIPNWVKKQYSPRESWKDKPFGSMDAQFFFKGIQELSDLFTEDRPKGMPAYFLHPKYRSGYLLYFLPLQAAKMISLFRLHPGAPEAAVQHGKKTGVIRIADVGAGPGTASIAFLLWLLGRKLEMGEVLPEIELNWFDTNATTMEDGQALVELLASHFPRLRGKVKINTYVTPIWKAASILKDEQSLIFLAHVLNEAPITKDATLAQSFTGIIEKMSGGGMLLIEPAARRPAQMLSHLRDQLIEEQWIDPSGASIWGPCLHAGRCPLGEGRDWCHFSVPVEVPGEYFKIFSRNLSSERQWLKFSYIWIASKAYPAPVAASQMRRVVSDPLSANKETASSVLLCEPEQPYRYRVSGNAPIRRGDVIKKIPAGPLSGSSRH